jgi:hypothetical protein
MDNATGVICYGFFLVFIKIDQWLQVKVSEVKCSQGNSSLFNSSIVTGLTLINNVTPFKTNGRRMGCKGLLGLTGFDPVWYSILWDYTK